MMASHKDFHPSINRSRPKQSFTREWNRDATPTDRAA